MLNFGANPNIENKAGDTAIILAVKWGAKSVFLRKLFKAGADVDLVNRNKNTALIEAFDKLNLSQANILLSCGADKHIANLKNQTGLSLIMSKLAEMRKKPGTLNDHIKKFFEEAEDYDEESDSDSYLSESENISPKSKHRAIRILKSLLFFEPIYVDHLLKSPEKILDKLLSNIQLLDKMTQKERVVFYYSMLTCHDSLTTFLLQEQGQFESDHYSIEILYHLIEERSDFFADNLNKEKQSVLGTLLEFAIEKSDFHIVHYLLKIGGNPHLTYKKNSMSSNMNDISLSAFDFAIMTNNLNMMKLIQKFDPDTECIKGLTSIHYLCLYGYGEKISDFVNLKEDLHLQDSLGNTPIYYAIYHPQLLKNLLVYRPDILIKNRDGETALSLAKRLNFKESVKVLSEFLEEKQETFLFIRSHPKTSFSSFRTIESGIKKV